MELLNFAGTRGDNNHENILELTDIQNPEALEQNPLEVELDIDLAENKFILPLAFDGDHILLTGEHAPDLKKVEEAWGKARLEGNLSFANLEPWFKALVEIKHEGQGRTDSLSDDSITAPEKSTTTKRSDVEDAVPAGG